MARRSIDEMAALARDRKPLFTRRDRDESDDTAGDDSETITEVRSRNGRVAAVLTGRGDVPPPGKRGRSPREVLLDADPHHKRREAARKRALRARRRLEGRRAGPGDERLASVPWVAHVPDGPTFEVMAYSHREARRLARQFLGLGRGKQLPPGTYLFQNTNG